MLPKTISEAGQVHSIDKLRFLASIGANFVIRAEKPEFAFDFRCVAIDYFC